MKKYIATSLKAFAIIFGASALLLFIFLLVFNLDIFIDPKIQGEQEIDRYNISLDEKITSPKKACEISEKLLSDWDKDLKLTGFEILFKDAYDIESLNAGFVIDYSKRESWQWLKTTYTRDSHAMISMRYSSNKIDRIFAIKSKILTISDIEVNMNGHLLTMEDIPQIIKSSFGENWKEIYGNIPLSIRISSDAWKFEFESEITNKRYYLLVNPFTKEVFEKCERSL